MAEPLLTWQAHPEDRYTATRGTFHAEVESLCDWSADGGPYWLAAAMWGRGTHHGPERCDSLELAQQWAEEQAAAYRAALLAEMEAWR